MGTGVGLVPESISFSAFPDQLGRLANSASMLVSSAGSLPGAAAAAAGAPAAAA